jgi:hypothetical protein
MRLLLKRARLNKITAASRQRQLFDKSRVRLVFRAIVNDNEIVMESLRISQKTGKKIGLIPKADDERKRGH